MERVTVYVARSNAGGGPERTLQIVSPPATAPRLLSLHGQASPSQHPPATLCRLGSAAAPRAALLAGGLTAHSNPLCRVSRPSPRQVFGFDGGRLVGTEVEQAANATPTTADATENRSLTAGASPMDGIRPMELDDGPIPTGSGASLRGLQLASASSSLHPALVLARACHGRRPAKKEGHAAAPASNARSPACQPAPARSYRERDSDTPFSH